MFDVNDEPEGRFLYTETLKVLHRMYQEGTHLPKIGTKNTDCGIRTCNGSK